MNRSAERQTASFDPVHSQAGGASPVTERVPWSPLRIALIRSGGALGLGALLFLVARAGDDDVSAALGIGAAAFALFGAAFAGGALRGAGRVGLRLRPRAGLLAVVLFVTNLVFLVAGAVLAFDAFAGRVHRGDRENARPSRGPTGCAARFRPADLAGALCLGHTPADGCPPRASPRTRTWIRSPVSRS